MACRTNWLFRARRCSRILQHYADRGETSNLTVDQHVQLMPRESKQNYEPADGRQILNPAQAPAGWRLGRNS